MRRRIAIVDLVAPRPQHDSYSRVMFPSFGTVMRQVISVWWQRIGYDVRLVPYAGHSDLDALGLDEFECVFCCAFTQAAHADGGLRAWLSPAMLSYDMCEASAPLPASLRRGPSESSNAGAP